MTNEENTPVEEPKPIFTGKVYDFIKKLVQLILPGVGTLYFTLAKIWGLPAAEQVVGSLTAIALFFGLLIGISSNRYNAGSGSYAGDLVVSTDGDSVTIKKLMLELTPEQIAGRKTIVFKVSSSLDE